MRVLAVADKFPPVINAGAEVMLHSMLRDLVRRGHESTVACDRAEDGLLDGVTVVRGGALDRLARDHDVLISHLNVAPRAARIAREAHRPFVQIVHNDRQLDPSSTAALVVWNSEWIRDRYAKWPGDSIVVRPPVALAEYRCDIRSKSFRGDVTLVNLARLKGGRLFWELAQLQPERHFLGLRGGYGDQIEPKKGLRNVEVLAHLPASRMRDEVYARTRVLLVPSQYESWGMAAIEAACAGIPVIAHPTPGLLESLGEAGLFADRTRVRDWIRLLELLDDPAEYAAASARVRARAEELDRVAKSDLDAFALRLEARVDAYAQPMAILGSTKLASRCPVCGARNCACGPTGGEDGVKVRRGRSRRGQPLREYEVGNTTLRLNDDDARARGLIPAEDVEEIVVLAEPAGDVPPVDGRIGELLAWAGEDDPVRIHAAIVAEREARNRPTLIAALERLLEEL